MAGGIKRSTGNTVANLSTHTPLTAIGATFADLAAARTAVNTLRTETEAVLAANETKINALLTALRERNIIG